jgi:uncharacterized membrane protein
MSPPEGAAGDRRLEAAIGRVLRLGVLASSACLGAGLAITLALGSTGLASGLLTTGLVILLATPAARVVVSTINYARERDWPFVVLTLTVLAELIASSIAARLSRFH